MVSMVSMDLVNVSSLNKWTPIKDFIFSELIQNLESFVSVFNDNGDQLFYYNYSGDLKVCILSDFTSMFVCEIIQPLIKEIPIELKNKFEIISFILESKDLHLFVPPLKTLFKCIQFHLFCDPLYFVLYCLNFHYHSETKTPFLILPKTTFNLLSIEDPDLEKIEIFESHCCKIIKIN